MTSKNDTTPVRTAGSASAIPERALEVRLASRPSGPIAPEHFAVVGSEVRRPGAGEVLVRNLWMGVTHAMSTMLKVEPHPDLPPWMPAYPVGQALWFPCVGTVVESRSPGLAVGDLVSHRYGWRAYATGDVAEFTRLDLGLLPGPQYLLTSGPTAWRGIVEVAGVKDGDTVFVSSAAGAVGSLAGQIARRRGAKRVIGSAGSKEKAGYLVSELGYDAAFDYHDGVLTDRLAALAPDGIDVFFDNVGGEQFEAALANAAGGARFALCGALSGQNPELDLDAVIRRDVTVRGFTSSYDPRDVNAWNERFGRWLQEGHVVFPHSVVEGGVAAVPGALVALLRGDFTGTVLVKLSD